MIWFSAASLVSGPIRAILVLCPSRWLRDQRNFFGEKKFKLRGLDLNQLPPGYEPERSILSPAESDRALVQFPQIPCFQWAFFAQVLPKISMIVWVNSLTVIEILCFGQISVFGQRMGKELFGEWTR